MVWLFIICVIVGTGGVLAAYRLGYRRGAESTATWFVRPHTARTLARMPDAEQAEPRTSQAVFVRDNLPGSTSKME